MKTIKTHGDIGFSILRKSENETDQKNRNRERERNERDYHLQNIFSVRSIYVKLGNRENCCADRKNSMYIEYLFENDSRQQLIVKRKQKNKREVLCEWKMCFQCDLEGEILSKKQPFHDDDYDWNWVFG